MQTYLLTSDYLKKTVPIRYTKLIKPPSALHSSYSLVSCKLPWTYLHLRTTMNNTQTQKRERERERNALRRRQILSKLYCPVCRYECLHQKSEHCFTFGTELVPHNHKHKTHQMTPKYVPPWIAQAWIWDNHFLLWGVTLSSLVDGYQRFGENYIQCYHIPRIKEWRWDWKENLIYKKNTSLFFIYRV